MDVTLCREGSQPAASGGDCFSAAIASPLATLGGVECESEAGSQHLGDAAASTPTCAYASSRRSAAPRVGFEPIETASNNGQLTAGLQYPPPR